MATVNQPQALFKTPPTGSRRPKDDVIRFSLFVKAKPQPAAAIQGSTLLTNDE